MRWLAARIAVPLALAALTLAGCNDNDLGIERRRPNRPPETILSSSPRDSTRGTSYRVQLFWSGADVDGTVDHFDFVMIDHLRARDCIDCPPNDPDRVVVEVPQPDDPRWTATTNNDTLIVTRADTLRYGTRPRQGQMPPEDRDISNQADSALAVDFERWHTFFVRAVDNEGQVDATPEYVSFNSRTLAPTVELLAPINDQEEEFTGPMVIVFNWGGQDPVGDNTFLEPIASRSTWIRSRRNPAGKWDGYPYAFYDLPASAWTPWKRWDAADGSGRRRIVTFPDNINDGVGTGFFMFAVQAMDEAGAVTPVFDARSAGKNNVARVVVRGGEFGATLIVNERFLGQFTFVGHGTPVSLSVAAGQPIDLRWRGDASSYGGSIVAFRYGWNIRNPDDDEQWEQNWCEVCRRAPTRVFNSGIQRFFLETRDNAESVTHAEIELVVSQVTRRRDLLLVDDTDNFDGDPQNPEAREDANWASVIEELRLRQPFPFDPTPGPDSDLYDVNFNRRQSPPIGKVFDYKTIVWNAKLASSGFTSLRDVAGFFDPFAADAANQVPKFNYLNIYVDNGGEFWLSGQQPTDLLWRFRPGGGQRPYPFNVTNWPDPAHPPGEDSVGVQSFLWRLGAEAVDLGGGGRGQLLRDNSLHYCTGFRRATPQGSDRQTFRSSLAVDHTHDLVVLTADVEAAPMGGVTYTTTTAPPLTHTHTVTLSQDDLRALARGGLIDVRTSDASEPSTHSHAFQLVDQIGLWGAPQQLVPQSALWASAPNGARHSVEIYNMPRFMAQETPPLNPDPKIWEPLYNYMSVTPADSATGYPRTADGQPAFILRKITVNDRFYSRAYCGFEVWRLQPQSHLALADFILLRHFRLGLPDGS